MTRPQILGLGLDDRFIIDRKRAGELVRLGPGLYADARFTSLSAEEQHVIRCHAVATRFEDSVVFSHQSAALLHGAATWDLPLDDLHVTRSDYGRGRTEAHVNHHVGDLPDEDVTTVDGLFVVSPARMVWDVATTSSIEPAVVTADSALHNGMVTMEELERIARRCTRWRHARRAKVALMYADGRAESAGESRTRLAISSGGLPQAMSQYKIYDHNGILIAVTDFAWPEYRHVLEFDGMLKYSGSLDLAKEKAREDAIRAAGWGVTRTVWSQLNPGVREAWIAQLQQALIESRRQFGHLAA